MSHPPQIGTTTGQPEAPSWVRPTTMALLALGGFWVVAWIHTVLHQDPEVWRRDWYRLWSAGVPVFRCLGSRSDRVKEASRP